MMRCRVWTGLLKAAAAFIRAGAASFLPSNNEGKRSSGSDYQPGPTATAGVVFILPLEFEKVAVYFNNISNNIGIEQLLLWFDTIQFVHKVVPQFFPILLVWFNKGFINFAWFFFFFPFSSSKSSSAQAAGWYGSSSCGFVRSAISAAPSFWRPPILLDLRQGDDLGHVIEMCLQSRGGVGYNASARLLILTGPIVTHPSFRNIETWELTAQDLWES